MESRDPLASVTSTKRITLMANNAEAIAARFGVSLELAKFMVESRAAKRP